MLFPDRYAGLWIITITPPNRDTSSAKMSSATPSPTSSCSELWAEQPLVHVLPKTTRCSNCAKCAPERSMKRCFECRLVVYCVSRVPMSCGVNGNSRRRIVFSLPAVSGNTRSCTPRCARRRRTQRRLSRWLGASGSETRSSSRTAISSSRRVRLHTRHSNPDGCARQPN